MAPPHERQAEKQRGRPYYPEGRDDSRERHHSRRSRSRGRYSDQEDRRRGSSPRRQRDTSGPANAEKPSVFNRLGPATATRAIAAHLDPPAELPAAIAGAAELTPAVGDLLQQLQDRIYTEAANGSDARLKRQLQACQQELQEKSQELQKAQAELAEFKREMGAKKQACQSLGLQLRVFTGEDGPLATLAAKVDAAALALSAGHREQQLPPAAE